MARGDLTVFEELAYQVAMEMHIWDTDVLKLGIIDNTTPPTAADGTPTWSDYVGNEVATTGNYTANGETIGNVSWNEANGVGTLDGDPVVISQHGSGFTDGYWGIVYNDTEATDAAICFIELGGPVSEQDGDVTITFHASGILTITVT